MSDLTSIIKPKKCCCLKDDTCRCKEIKTIQRYIRTWFIKINELAIISYQKEHITYRSINVFTEKERSKNDSNNKKREAIIVSIINNKIPKEYYIYSLRWYNLKNTIDLFIKNLCETKNIIKVDSVSCIHKGGRNSSYDFKFIVNKSEEFLVEFKFNAYSVNDTPQFVSPMKPSQYLESSYEEYYYENYLTTLVNEFNMSLPTKEEYLKRIHSTNPKCVKELQDKYYRGCIKSSKYSGKENDIDFYKASIKTAKRSILNFISNYDLVQDKLTEYLVGTQKNKNYMLYKDSNIHLEKINVDQYIITEITKDPKGSRYIAKTKSGEKLKILMRWKNGNGIAFPCFQIS
jgi:hypothetical protein